MGVTTVPSSTARGDEAASQSWGQAGPAGQRVWSGGNSPWGIVQHKGCLFTMGRKLLEAWWSRGVGRRAHLSGG